VARGERQRDRADSSVFHPRPPFRSEVFTDSYCIGGGGGESWWDVEI
jgi:hypothetical protein